MLTAYSFSSHWSTFFNTEYVILPYNSLCFYILLKFTVRVKGKDGSLLYKHARTFLPECVHFPKERIWLFCCTLRMKAMISFRWCVSGCYFLFFKSCDSACMNFLFSCNTELMVFSVESVFCCCKYMYSHLLCLLCAPSQHPFKKVNAQRKTNGKWSGDFNCWV